MHQVQIDAFQVLLLKPVQQLDKLQLIIKIVLKPEHHVLMFAEILERPVACKASGRCTPGRYDGFSCAAAISAASSGRRAHSVVGALPAAIVATVVPHEPAPMTAIRVTPTGVEKLSGLGPWQSAAALTQIGATGTMESMSK